MPSDRFPGYIFRGHGAALLLAVLQCRSTRRCSWTVLAGDRPTDRRHVLLAPPHILAFRYHLPWARRSSEGNRDGNWSVGCLRCITRRDLRPLRHVCLSVALYQRRLVSLNGSPAIIAVNYHTTELPDFVRSLLLRLVNIATGCYLTLFLGRPTYVEGLLFSCFTFFDT